MNCPRVACGLFTRRSGRPSEVHETTKGKDLVSMDSFVIFSDIRNVVGHYEWT